MVLESLIPGLETMISGMKLPEHVKQVSAEGIFHVKLIDATPIGINVRSTVATYANVHDELRKIYARTPEAKDHQCKAGDFSYNTGKLRCRSAMVLGRSAWMSSSCRMWMCPVPSAKVPGMVKRLGRFIIPTKRETFIHCRN